MSATASNKMTLVLALLTSGQLFGTATAWAETGALQSGQYTLRSAYNVSSHLPLQAGTRVEYTGRYGNVGSRASGNWTVEIKVLDGSLAGRNMWIYYRPGDLSPGQLPAAAQAQPRNIRSGPVAGVRTTADNLIQSDEDPTELVGSGDVTRPQDALAAVVRGTDAARRLNPADCVDCRVAAQPGVGALDQELARVVTDPAARERIKQQVPQVPLLRALQFYNRMKQSGDARYQIRGDRLVVVDLTAPSNQKRMFMVDLRTGAVEPYLTSHGGVANARLCADRFGNRHGSNLSSGGGFVTGATYYSAARRRRSMRLLGVESDNNNVMGRGVVFHTGRGYVGGGQAGRTQGCLTSEDGLAEDFMARMRADTSTANSASGGRVIYIYPNSDDVRNGTYWNQACAADFQTRGVRPSYVR